MSDVSSFNNLQKHENILHPLVNVAPQQQRALIELSTGRKNLRKWLGKTFRVMITDGRVLVGFFNCTDKDANLVLSMCTEYLEEGRDARILGNVMIPGKHIVSIAVDMPKDIAAGRVIPTKHKQQID